MYVISVHAVSDPKSFWGGQLDLPEGTELPIVVPSADGTRRRSRTSPGQGALAPAFLLHDVLPGPAVFLSGPQARMVLLTK